MLQVLLVSCCMITNRKCSISENDAVFRIVDAANEHDLFFGMYKQYDWNLIKLFSLEGNDTIFHQINGRTFSNNQDSLLFVYFNSRVETVYVSLNGSDIDTLRLSYDVHMASSCCEEFSYVNPLSYNLRGLITNGNFYTCYK